MVKQLKTVEEFDSTLKENKVVVVDYTGMNEANE